MQDRIYLPVIGVVSIIIPIVVALLLYLPERGQVITGFNVHILPLLNACINSTVTVMLLIGYWAIRNKNMQLHKTCMLSSFVLSGFFLVSYIIYHYQTEPTLYGGTGAIRYVYFVILFSHIILATLIVPLALLSIYRGLGGKFALHKKISRWTLPIWLYVSITGVLVYLMISPYYN